jgi:hypothetical protein
MPIREKVGEEGGRREKSFLAVHSNVKDFFFPFSVVYLSENCGKMLKKD